MLATTLTPLLTIFTILCVLPGLVAGLQPRPSEPITEVANKSMRFVFTSCGNTGSNGPTAQQCKSTYKQANGINSSGAVVITEGWLSGTQVWTVPETAVYGITAQGANGGSGVRSIRSSNGAYVHARFNLTKGQLVYMVIGQQGESACMQNEHSTVIQTCRHYPGRLPSRTSIYENDTRVGTVSLIGGGGGGGGGTFVILVDPATNAAELLMVAGGGGGMAFDPSNTDVDRHTLYVTGSAPVTGWTTSKPTLDYETNLPKPGSDWPLPTDVDDDQYIATVLSVPWAIVGSESCERAKRNGWKTAGGFGGGGGGCTAGGGGGGYRGGKVSSVDSQEENGHHGLSYVSLRGSNADVSSASHNRDGDGWVEILFVLDCPCEFLCLYTNYVDKIYKCYCRPNYVLDTDQLHCISSLHVQSSEAGSTFMSINKELVALFVVGVCVMISLAIICAVRTTFRKRRRRSRRRRCVSPPTLTPASVLEQSAVLSMEPLTSANGVSVGHCLEPLRHSASLSSSRLHRAGMVTQFNPHYDFGADRNDDVRFASPMTWKLDDLGEMSRDQLVLIRALGQGAFGEVYEGSLKNDSREPLTQRVAVKTLPVLSNDESEMDFFMEAMIMSKFSHPNIVRFIGVCFKQKPRFIILELLGGGDLKTFLRNNRPKPEKPSCLSGSDLLKLALNIAEGCRYLENNRFIHRDIAARNCLLTSSGPDRVAKIADFGMARDIYRADYYRKGGRAMLPVKWMPPEAFLDGIFTSKTDVWSFGVLLWEVFSLGYMPYPGRGNHEVMQLVADGIRLDAPSECPSVVYEAMTSCWHATPACRPDFGGVIDRLHACLLDETVLRYELIGSGALKGVRYLTADSGYRNIVDPLLVTRVNQTAGDVVDSQRQWDSNQPSISVASDGFNDDDDVEMESPWKPLSRAANDFRSDNDVDRKLSQPLLYSSKLPHSNCRSPSDEINLELDHQMKTPGCVSRDNLVDNDDYCMPLGGNTATVVKMANR